MKFNPDPTYGGLLVQAYALHNLANSYERQLLALQKEFDKLNIKISLIGEEAINAERATNEMLTNEIDKMKELQRENKS